jgi:hypothetical protein
MHFARTWSKVPFLGVRQQHDGQGRNHCHSSRRRVRHLDLDLGSEARVCGLSWLADAGADPTLATATSGPATPSEFVTELSLLRSQRPSLASSGAVDGPPALSLTPPPSSTLAPAAGQAARTILLKPGFMAAAPEWVQVAAGRRLALPRRTIALLMSGSFVHRRIIAGCRCSTRHLPSGPHEEACHANQ